MELSLIARFDDISCVGGSASSIIVASGPTIRNRVVALDLVGLSPLPEKVALLIAKKDQFPDDVSLETLYDAGVQNAIVSYTEYTPVNGKFGVVSAKLIPGSYTGWVIALG